MAGSWRSDAWRLRALRAALLLVPLLAVEASARPEPLRPSTAAVRLGSVDGYFSIGGVTKEGVAPPSRAPVEVELGELPAGKLHVGAMVVEQPTVIRGPWPAPVHCSARLSGSRQAGTDVVVERDRWTAGSLDVSGTRPGDRLVMACSGAFEETTQIAWARPLFVPAPNGPAPLIVIVSLDTLRADHVSGFGAAPGVTPALERLGREGVRLTETMAEATWTIPSHFALFYGRLYGFPAERPPLRGLAQLLADHGYVTAGFTGGGFMGAYFRFHIGFDHFREYDARDFGGSDVRLLPHVIDDAQQWMTRFADVPLAMFVHTYAVHEPTPSEVAWQKERPDRPLEQFVPSPAQVAAARTQYGELVTKTDAVLGPFFDRLRAVAAERPLLLVVVSDHGEAFWEHQNYRHGDDGPRVTLHDEVTRVPVIVWGPTIVAEGVVSRRPTMLSDVAPSILAAAGIPRSAGMVGEDLWSSWSAATPRDHGAGAAPPSVSRSARGWALRSRGYKLIAEHVAGAPARFELYDLRRDPHERRNLAPRHPRAVEALRWRLTRRVAALTGTAIAVDVPVCPLCTFGDMEAFWDGALLQGAGGDRHAIGAATRERLRALGYAGR